MDLIGLCLKQKSKVMIGLIWLFVGVACSTKMDKQEPPLWYFEHIEDTGYFYGYGSARSKEGAEAEALRDLHTQLRLNVQSQMQLLTQQHDDLFVSMPESIFISVPEIESSQVHVSKSVYFDGIYYVRIEISKDILLEEFKIRYSKHLKILEQIAQIPCELNARDLWRLQFHLKEVGRLGGVLEVFGGKRAKTQKYYQILQKNPIKPSLNLKFTVNDECYKQILEKIFKKDLGKFYKITSKAKDYANVSILIDHSQNGSVMSLEFDLRDCQNKQIFQAKSTIANSVKGSYESIRLNAVKISDELSGNLKNWIEERGQ